MDIKAHLKWRLQYFFLKLLRLKFYAKQNLPPINSGYESFHLKDPKGAYFYGTVKEFELFHRNVIKKSN